jgi:hypothetical protein
MSPRIPIAGGWGARRLGRAETRIGEVQKQGPGPWIWIGDYPTDSYTTYWSPPWENDWDRPALPYAPLAFRYSIDGRIEFGGYPQGIDAISGTVAFTLAEDWRGTIGDQSQIRDVVIGEKLVAARYQIDGDTGELTITLLERGSIRNIKLFADPNACDGNLDESVRVVVAGDGKWVFEIDRDEDEYKLFYVRAFVSLAGSGTISVQLHNITQGVDMLSTKVTIDSGELSSKTAAVPYVVNDATSQVLDGDQIRLDVDDAGAGAEGLGVNIGFRRE